MTISQNLFSVLFLFGCLFIFTSCGSVDPLAIERSDEELAADVLVNNRHLHHFKRAFDVIDPAKFIVISLENTNASSQIKGKLTLTYNRDLRSWQVDRALYQYSSNGDVPYELMWQKENMQDQISWLDLISALEENNLLFIPSMPPGDSGTKATNIETYVLRVRIADRLKEVEWRQPMVSLVANTPMYRQSNFERILTIMHRTFGEIGNE